MEEAGGGVGGGTGQAYLVKTRTQPFGGWEVKNQKPESIRESIRESITVRPYSIQFLLVRGSHLSKYYHRACSEMLLPGCSC